MIDWNSILKKKKKPPRTRLRKVVRQWSDTDWRAYDVLECGHTIKARKDWYGTAEVNSERRRCRQCVIEEQRGQNE